MVQERVLSQVLSEFASAMVTDFPIQAILDHLVERIVEVLPITGAGVTLISKTLAPRYVAASDATALRNEQLQSGLRQGPCLTAFTTGEAVLLPDLALTTNYPQFAPAAAANGTGAVFTFPLRHGSNRLGALDLYRDVPGPLSARTREVAWILADVAAAYLINAESRAEAMLASEWFRDQSLHDPLTGLPNRMLLQQRIEHAAERARRTRRAVAVMFVDLDRFKRVNDDFGHPVGDDLLVAVAQRLSTIMRTGDTLARVSGDEFVFLCEDLMAADDVDILAARIDESFAAPFKLRRGPKEIAVTASVGIAYAGPGAEVTEHLVLDADMAMYQAKRAGGARHQIIDLRDAAQSHNSSELERDLQAADLDEQFELAYQPIVRPADAALVGVEALLRWTHPERGPVPAAATVALAEKTGLVTRIGTWVLERSCRDWMVWSHDHPHRHLDLSVNVSPRQLTSAGFAASVAAVLDKTGMDPESLILEVTEGILIEDGDRAMRVLAALKGLGVRLALDDFGTGYCSLKYLQRFPVDIVKIDQSFVSNIGADDTATAIAASVTSLAHILRMTVTAEGVETEQQRDEIVALGCDTAQGYLYARPMTATDFATQLTAAPA